MNPGSKITLLLNDWSNGDKAAGEALAPLIYDELYKRSANLFRGESPGHTLQPTALINEAFVRLINADVSWTDRTHFFAVASRMMRRLLIDHAKSRAAQKRGGDQIRVTFDESQLGADGHEVELSDLTNALADLKQADARKAEIVDLYYFGGLTVEEIEQVTNISTATIGRDLRFARAWLSDALETQT